MTRLFLYLRTLLGWHRHYYGVPHYEKGELIATCYECGRNRPVRMRLV